MAASSSLTGGFAPIPGAGAGARAPTASNRGDLTSGLIALGSHGASGGGSGRLGGHGDVDFGDFDVDGLLLDDDVPARKSTSAKGGEKSPKKPKKKKKSSSGSNSSKKPKKSKKAAGRDDDDDGDGDENEDDAENADDWDKPHHGRETTTTTATSMPAPKKMSALDEEFARMLGLDDDFAASSSPPEQDDATHDEEAEAVAVAVGDHRDANDGTSAAAAVQVAPADSDDAVRGLDASFFAEPNGPNGGSGDADDGGLGFLLSSSDRRRGREGASVGGGRRGARSKADDPFAPREDVPKRRGLDDLFAPPSQTRGGPIGAAASGVEPEAAPSTSQRSTLDALFGGGGDSSGVNRAAKPSSTAVDRLPDSGRRVPRENSSSTNGNDGNASVADDLLAELFPTAPPSSRPAKDPKPTPTPTPTSDDLLAELFPAEATLRAPTTTTAEAPPAPTTRRPESMDDGPSTSLRAGAPAAPTTVAPPANEDDRGRMSSAPQEPPATATPTLTTTRSGRGGGGGGGRSAGSGALGDIQSSRDDLLKDLVPDSPPKSRRRRESSREQDTDERPAAMSVSTPTPAPAPAPAPPSPPPAVAAVPRSPSPTSRRGDRGGAGDAAVGSNSRSDPTAMTTMRTSAGGSSSLSPAPSPSPGKTKMLSAGTPSKVREVEFEQSKDELLEELLSSPAPSPARAEAEAPMTASTAAAAPTTLRSRHNSYSLSWDPELSTPADAGTAIISNSINPPPPPVTTMSAPAAETTATATAAAPPTRRPSWSPQREPAASSPKHTVFLRDERAEEALRQQHAAALTALEAAHAERVLGLERQLAQAESRVAALTTENARQRDDLERLGAAHAAAEQTAAELTTAATLRETALGLAQDEKAALGARLEALEAQHRELLQQLVAEKHAHQRAEMAFAAFRRDHELAAGLRDEHAQQQLERLCHQLEGSLAHWRLLQEDAGHAEAAQRDIESAARLRVVTSLEATSRTYAQQAEDGCARLAGLVTSLEAALRQHRHAHLEDKERLRHEQLRLDALAAHFQAQSSALQDSAEAHSRLVATQLQGALADARVAEARLASRRQRLEDDAQALFAEQARFAAHRDEVLAQHERLGARLEHEREELQRARGALERDRDELDAVLAAHDGEFQALAAQERALAEERERLAAGARQVAAMAERVDLAAQQVAAQERALAEERAAMASERERWAAHERAAAAERQRLETREARLHTQLQQMDRARRRLNAARKEQLQVAQQQHPRLPAHIGAVTPIAPPKPSVAPSTMAQTTTTSASWDSQAARPSVPTKAAAVAPPLPVWRDPSGLSPAFRALIEDNWKQQQWGLDLADAALHKERMAIHALGLDPTTPCDFHDDDDNDGGDNNRSNRPTTGAHGRHHRPRAQCALPPSTPSARTSKPPTLGPSVRSAVVAPPPPPPLPPRAAPGPRSMSIHL